MADEERRLNKFLSESGVCSRREADRLIGEGRVLVDGRAAVTGMKIAGSQQVLVDGKLVRSETRRRLVAVNKPCGVVCTTDRRWGDRLLEDVVKSRERLFSIGRLDKASEGLILMTNQGDLLNKIMKADNYHEKEYIVQVDRPLTAGVLQSLERGVYLRELDRMTRPCQVTLLGKDRFSIILTQGLNRQIRRMCAAFDYRVIALKRIRIMNIRLGDLAAGAYREVTDEEWRQLSALLADSVNDTQMRCGKAEKCGGRRPEGVRR